MTKLKEYRKSMDNMKIRGIKCPRPIKIGISVDFLVGFLEIIAEQKYERPTRFKPKTIPVIMSGRI